MYRLSNYADLKEGTMIAKIGFIKAIGLLNSKYIRVSYNILSFYYIMLHLNLLWCVESPFIIFDKLNQQFTAFET